MTRNRRLSHRMASVVATFVGISFILGGALSASAAAYPQIDGNGSSWAGAAIKQWMADVKAQGVTVNYNDDGSSSGRKRFAEGMSDFAVSEIPYDGDTADPQDTTRPEAAYSMLPIVAGGTSFMYNLPVNGQRFEDLRLSQEALAGIFTGQITRWNDPAIMADNPGVNLPANGITVVVRSDGSGASAQFTLWLKRMFPEKYAALCAIASCNPNAATSYFPYQGLANFTAQARSDGVTKFTTGTEYTINYDEYAYPLGVGFPVAKVKNAAGFYTVPTDTAVAVALTQAQINTDQSSPNYLSQDLSAVYGYGDPRSYAMSAYSYLLVPAQERGQFVAAEGATLGYFTQYSLCEGQRKMGALGYSPLPMNLVLAAMDQVRKIPGVDADTMARLDAVRDGVLSGGTENPCNNPTFQPGDSPSHNLLVDTAAFPDGCDEACQAPWRLAGAGVAISGPQFDAAGGPVAAGAAAGPTAAAAGPAATGTPVCDPNTGICSNETTTALGRNVKTVPTVLAGSNGWAGPQSLMTIAGLLMLAVLVAPPLVNRWLGSRRDSSGGGV